MLEFKVAPPASSAVLLGLFSAPAPSAVSSTSTPSAALLGLVVAFVGGQVSLLYGGIVRGGCGGRLPFQIVEEVGGEGGVDQGATFMLL